MPKLRFFAVSAKQEFEFFLCRYQIKNVTLHRNRIFNINKINVYSYEEDFNFNACYCGCYGSL